jgi:hypothetical protein
VPKPVVPNWKPNLKQPPPEVSTKAPFGSRMPSEVKKFTSPVVPNFRQGPGPATERTTTQNFNPPRQTGPAGRTITTSEQFSNNPVISKYIKTLK